MIFTGGFIAVHVQLFVDGCPRKKKQPKKHHTTGRRPQGGVIPGTDNRASEHIHTGLTSQTCVFLCEGGEGVGVHRHSAGRCQLTGGGCRRCSVT